MSASEGLNVIPRGLGRSYGDAAQSAGGVVIDTSGLGSVLASDLDAGWVKVGAGMSLDSLMRWLLPRGWWVPVTPGTRHVTLGGAIAADIHGKNHHRDGSFCSYVNDITLAAPKGNFTLTPGHQSDLFWATAGGMGLTGVVLDATVRLIEVESAYMLVDIERANDLDDCMARMTERDSEYRYSVAWIDCLARGSKLGRAVLTRADHARRSELPRTVRDPFHFEPRQLFGLPFTAPAGVLNRFTVSAFNGLWYLKAPRERVRRVRTIASYFHPLDGIGSWNRLYGPKGFLQYQVVLPFGAEQVLRRVLETLSTSGVASLAVLKRFGRADPAPLSFPIPGWTLAVDMPLSGTSLGPLLDEIDEQVAEAGGRVYLAKDSRLRPELFRKMYPRVDEWLSVRDSVDPEGILTSDLSQRLGIVNGSKTLHVNQRGNPGRS